MAISNHLDQQGSEECGPSKNSQLELEIQAFAELLLDIYEYRQRQKEIPNDSRGSFDAPKPDSKMRVKVEEKTNFP